MRWRSSGNGVGKSASAAATAGQVAQRDPRLPERLPNPFDNRLRKLESGEDPLELPFQLLLSNVRPAAAPLSKVQWL